MKVNNNLLVENMVLNKLISRLHNPCLAVPLRDLVAGCGLVEISKLADIFRQLYIVVQDRIPEIYTPKSRYREGRYPEVGDYAGSQVENSLHHRPHSDSS